MKELYETVAGLAADRRQVVARAKSEATNYESEPLEGKIITKLPSSISHNGIRLTVNGSVTLQVRGGSAGVIESLYGVLKPIPIV
ncbi:unnamed protein product [Camellia sinensis]